MNRARCSALLLLAVAAQTARAAEDGASPSCVPEASVRENPGFRNDTWLSRERGDTVRMHLAKVMGSSDWRGQDLYGSCEQVSTPCMVARLESGPTANPTFPTPKQNREYAGLQKEYFQDLARASGHTKQEADVLGGRYASLAGAYFRQVPKPGGGWESEDVAITRRHRERLGIQGPVPGEARPPPGDTAETARLKARIAEAKKRGDVAEMMRLLGEAQKAASGASKAAGPTPGYQQQTWLLFESSYTDLLTAAYWSRIYVSGMCICASRCRLPIGEGADRNR
jgi:hypothetical protein